MQGAYAPRVQLLALTLLAAGLRWFGLDARELWIDEAFSLWMARLPWPELLSTAAQLDHHPPLYYALLHIWVAGAGESEYGLRLLSAGVSVASVPLAYQFAVRLVAGPRARLTAALITVAPFHIAYAQEARMYALLAFFALWTMICAADVLGVGANTAKRSTPPARRVRAGVWMGVGQALVMWSHNSAAVLFPLALNGAAIGWLGYQWLRQTRAAPTVDKRRCLDDFARSHTMRDWLMGQAIAALLWVAWLPAFWGQVQAVDQRFWVPVPTLETLWLAWQAWSYGHPPGGWLDGGWLMGAIWFATFAGVAGRGGRTLQRQGAVLGWLLGLWLIAPAMALALSLRRPVFLPSTLIWTTWAYWVIVATGLVELLRGAWSSSPGRVDWRGAAKFVRAIGAGCAIMLMSAALLGGLWGHYRAPPREAWREAAAVVADDAKSDDLLLFHASWTELPFRYHARARGWDLDEAMSVAGIPVDLFTGGELEPPMTAADVSALRAAIAPYPRVWLVYSHAWYTDPDGLVPATLGAEMVIVQHHELTGVDVYLFARVPD
ncbi:MAG: glycosyltransferase family 39 protein [Litorilinea sp.]